MWDLPRPGLEPVSPALAGRFLTTAPPGKALYIVFWEEDGWGMMVVIHNLSKKSIYFFISLYGLWKHFGYYKIWFTWNLNNGEAGDLFIFQQVNDKGAFLEICLGNWGSGFNPVLLGYCLFCRYFTFLRISKESMSALVEKCYPRIFVKDTNLPIN